jgi:hypothetical protein
MGKETKMPRTSSQIFTGIFSIVFGIVGLSTVTSFPWGMTCMGVPLAEILIPVIPIAIGVFLIIGGTLTKQAGIEEEIGKPLVVQERVLVKVTCSYRGGLYDEALDRCPVCGGNR